ncbi:MAG: histone deacetylase [Vicinamibacterales bacterium]
MSLILIASERFAEHMTPPGHPESPERAEVMDVIAAEWRARGGEVVAPREASREQLARVHDAEHLRRMGETAGISIALDPDTYTSPDTYEVALLSAGAAVDATERVMGGTHTCAFVVSRPPGHHAERDRAMGFCFFNNVAVAAAHARALGAARVAIVDYDVHHGNGTQHIFENDPDVLYVSTHQFPYLSGNRCCQ